MAILEHTAAYWTAQNITMSVKDIGIESDTLRIKKGDGVTAWNSLPYASSPRKNHLFTNITPASNTAVTNEELLHSIFIPADLVLAGDMIETFSQFKVTPSANNKTFRIYIHTAESLSGATKIGTFTTSGATVNMSPLYRFLPVLSDTSIEALAANTTSVTGNYSQPAADNTQITVPSLSAGFYILISGQKASAGETLTCRWTKVEIKRV